MSLDFCCDIQMVGSEFGVKNMKAWILLLMATSSRIMHNVTKLKSSQTGFLNMTMVHFTQMASTVTRSQSNRAPLGCGGTEIRIMDLQQLRDAIMSIWTKISDVESML